MAKPSKHVIATVFLLFFVMFIEILLGISVTIKGGIVNFGILFVFGVMVDTDHIFPPYLSWWKNFMLGRKVVSPEGWQNKFHTFGGMAAVIMISILTKIYLWHLWPIWL